MQSVFNGGRKLLVYVGILEAAIFDFMTEEDWGEKKHYLKPIKANLLRDLLRPATRNPTQGTYKVWCLANSLREK